MKHIFSLLLVMVACCQISYSQKEDTIKLRKTEEERKRIIVTDRPPQAWYFNVGGSGLVFSANYDRRFGKRLDGPGFTGGVGLFFGGGLTVVTLP
ncbi:MAG TPA: hypothetical protein VLJ68_10070, partial [Chitinophagaceae bacterium]|nr:hypothetical protein [Chitinophagaceae bacterium]